MDGKDWYEYCRSNPLRYVDPDGREAVTAIYLYLCAIAASPDTALDIQFLSHSLASGDYLGAGLDLAGMLVPGVTGLSKADDMLRAAAKSFDNLAKAPTKSLTTNLLKAGYKKKAGEFAHHIIAQACNYVSAQKARAILLKYEIDIHSALNGVFLGDLHKGLHTHKYYDKVYSLLKRCKSKEEVVLVLRRIAQQLKDGKF